MSSMIQQEQQFNEMLLDKLVAHFGVTRFSKDGGYILQDGSLLNLQRSDMDNRQYHRAVAALLPKEMHGICDEITIVNLMTATGIIRYEARGRVHVAVKPTQLQRRKLFEIMKYSEHSYRILVSDSNGATIGDQSFKSPQAHELLQFFLTVALVMGKRNIVMTSFMLEKSRVISYLSSVRNSVRSGVINQALGILQ